MGAHHAVEQHGKFIDPGTTSYVDSEITQVTKVTDGDTVHITRQFTEIITDWTVTVTVDRYPIRARLIIVNTPERGKPLWDQARVDTSGWLYARLEFLRARTYGEDDFGRLLTDIYDRRTGESLSSFLIAKGYPPYTRK